MDKPLIKVKRKKEEKTQIISVMKEEPFTTEPMDSQKIIKEHYEQIYIHKFGNLDKMEQFFERHIYQNSYKENKPILIKEVE